MPNGWKKGVGLNKKNSRKFTAGGSSLQFCRCSSCSRSLARAKAGDGDIIEQKDGGKLACKNYVIHSQYVQRQKYNRKENEYNESRKSYVSRKNITFDDYDDENDDYYYENDDYDDYYDSLLLNERNDIENRENNIHQLKMQDDDDDDNDDNDDNDDEPNWLIVSNIENGIIDDWISI
jgi:hypothetical protein